MTDAQVNLAFLRSLGKNYEIFQQVTGDQTYKLKPGELYAKVRALAESKDEPDNINEINSKALALRISDHRSILQRDRGDTGRYKGGFRG